MVVIAKSIIAFGVSLLLWTPALGTALPDNQSPNELTAVDPFSGVSFDPYSGKGCSGTNQGNTNINPGTRACVNVSNAKSFKLIADQCDSAHFTFYHGLDCKNPTGAETNHGPGCYPKNGDYKSIYVKVNC